MPPRRSSRSTRASVEPQAIEKPQPKRKRSEASEDLADQENVKPRSRTRKPSATTSAPQTRTSRSKVTLHEVPESEEEDIVEEDAPPPVKKSRPSWEPDDSDVEEIEPEVKPAKAKRAPSTRSARVKQEPSSSARTSVAAASAQGTSRSSRRSTRGSTRQEAKVETDSEEPDYIVISEDDVEEVKPKPKSKSKPARKGRKPATKKAEPSRSDHDIKPSVKEEREVDKDEETDIVANQRENQEPPEAEEEKAEDEEEAGDIASEVAGDDIVPELAVEDEEKSLLDPPKSPTPKPQTQPGIPEEPQGPKKRLVIHKMALINFKSYAGRQEIGPFHKSFSSIVGPNGSGKSNTIDALLFVFGYRASKMRQSKLSELIHNSARYPDLDDCSVEVHFREIIDLPGPDAFEVVPNSQLVVARTAYKNNSSKYTINGRQSNYKEVQTLLKGRGIDLDHNRFLILQGEVESIAQMKPKAPSEHEDGLLEYLEDIIGTCRMERLSEDRAEKLNRLRIVERERNALEAKKREAEDYLRLQNNHVRALSRLWQWYLWKCLQNEEHFETTMHNLEKDLEEERERNRDDVTHLEMLQEHYQERFVTYEEVKAAAAEAAKDLTAREKQQVSLGEKRKHANGKAKKLIKSLENDEHAHAEALRAIDSNGAKIEKEKGNLEELEKSLAQEENILEEIRDSLKDKTQVFHDQIEEKQKELQPWMAKINSKQRRLISLRANGTCWRRRRKRPRWPTTELNRLKASRTSKQNEIKEGDRRLKASYMQAHIQELRAKASSSRQKAEEAKASQAASTSQNKVLDSLTRLRTAGRISGFHGRLGSLGTIPDKYDVAVSTACGALNNLIVDTVEQGQACIEYLRKQNVGRASFIVLEKLSSHGLEKIDTPENVPRLIDLIKPKEARFAPAFYKGVSNTLVANDLEQANRIAFGGSRRWRVVTLAGQLIDSSGTMSGGGNHVQRGGMSSKLAADAVSPEVLRQYEQDSEQAGQELEQVLRQLREIEAQLEGLTRAVPQLDIEIEKASLDMQTGARRIAELEKRVRELKNCYSTEELEGLQERTGSIEQEIKALEKKILEIGGARLLSQKSKVDGIRLHIGLANDEITKAEEVNAELQGLDEEINEVKELVKQIQEKVDAAQQAADNSKEDLQKLKEELDERTEEIQAFRQKEMELQQKLNDTKKEAADNGRLLEHWRTEHDNLQLEEVDDEEDEEEEQVHRESAEPVEGEVKPEPGSAPKRKARQRTPSDELHIYTEQELSMFKKREMIADAELLDEKLKNSKPDLGVLKDYRKREAEFLKRAQDLDHVTELRDAKKQEYDKLTKQRLDEFMAGFSMISLKLKEMYQMITLGGNAELELVDSMDPWRNISNLSGGEKTLSSLALVFALHVYKPTPLYFMDEIDAALDFRNVSIVANYIKDRTKNAQFIIISLRNDMFELSHRLIGIYKTANATRSISIDNQPLHAIPLNTAPS
ncbi:RecF/RecN/SMC N terminal domain-containing protein [Amylocystis lapponica]|nr:RecF/RecN/SMC N terminal domain-containing protein [Amylocystis lapponica]